MEKMYTTTEIVKLSGLTRAAVLKRARAYGFTKYCHYVLKKTCWGNYIKEFSFTDSQVKQMGCDHKVSLKSKYSNLQEDIEGKQQYIDTLEKLKKEHPLVTDVNCFNLNWWPETIPSVLQEYEE